MLLRVGLVRTDDSEKSTAVIIKVTRTIELETMLAHLVFLRSLRRLLVTANVVLSSPILVTLKMEITVSFKMSILTRATRLNIPEYGILQIHRRENLKY
jgi:hypothetical protein